MESGLADGREMGQTGQRQRGTRAEMSQVRAGLEPSSDGESLESLAGMTNNDLAGRGLIPGLLDCGGVWL